MDSLSPNSFSRKKSALSRFLPGQLPSKAIDEFQEIWKEVYGEDIARSEASFKAHQLLALLTLLTQMPSDKPSAQQHQ